MALHKKLKAKVTKKYSKIQLSIFALLFIAIGGYFIVNSFAATPSAATCDFTYTTSQVSTIQSTVSSSANAGKTVCLSPGTYPKLSFSGTHANAVVVQPDPAGDPNAAGKVTVNGISIASNATYITIRNFYVSGEIDFGSGNDHLTFDHNDITGGYFGINGGSVDCSVAHAPQYSGCSPTPKITNISVTGNRLHGFGASAEDALHFNNFNGINVAYNEITGVVEGGNHNDCLQTVYGGSNITFDHNYEHDNNCQGFFIKDGDVTNATVTNNLFVRNHIAGADENTVQVYDTHNYVFRNNTDWSGNGNIVRADTTGYTATVDHNVSQTFNNGCCSEPQFTLTENNNIFGSNPWTFTKNSTSVVNASPAFVNTAVDDYRLASNPNNIGVDWKPSDYTYGPTNAGSSNGCDLNATNSTTLATQVTAATTGKVICLSTGDYGTWQGTNKAITIKAAANATPTMKFSFGSGDTGFTMDGISNMGGSVIDGASKITIKNSTFTSTLDIDGSTIRGMVIDGNKFDWQVGPTFGGGNAKIFAGADGAFPGDGAIITNNTFRNGDLDGIHGGSGLLVTNNTFDNLCDFNQTQNGKDSNHTDNIQFEGGHQTRIAGNYFHASSSCPTQGITSFDSGTVGIIIENNVVDIHRPWGIEFYSDQNSIIRHNTVVYHPDSDCDFTGQPCGQIDINRKSADPAGSGTRVYDNITTDVGFNSGSTGTADHNISGINTVYVGGTSPTTWSGFALTSNSPCHLAASDGKDVGIDTSGVTTPVDITAPTVSVTSPTNNASVSGSSVTITANASDNVAVGGVQFKLDGNNLGSEDTTSPYSTIWNTTTASNGTHTLSAVARDTYGNTTTSTTVTVTVNNTTAKPGDTNNDGLVNIVDLSTLLSHYNTNYTSADFNKDSIVNITDLSILLSNFNK